MLPLLSLKDATFTYGERVLFNKIELHLQEDDKACLVGRNGEGKSTLLQVLAGLIELDKGERYFPWNTHIGYLPQLPFFEKDILAEEYIALGLNDISLAHDYRVQMIVDALKIPGTRKVLQLSGGEARRAVLARTLISEPNVLLLDEPTNHMDLQAIEWLEDYLSKYKGALLVISHDRYFLKQITNKTFWLDRGNLRILSKGYRAFEEWMEETYRLETQSLHKLDQKIANELLWLREGLSARRRRNQGRLRALLALRQSRKVHIHQKGLSKMTISEGALGGKSVCEIQNLNKTYQENGERKIIVKDFSFLIQRADRIGIIGPNGVGKTTFLKMLMGEIKPESGLIKWGEGIEPLYFDQKREKLDDNMTLWQILCPKGGDTVFINGQSKHVVGYLKDFLFDEKQVHHYVKALSGGEKNRLLLAKLFTKPSNLIILDEPTNDLDLETLDLLEEVISNYKGTLIIVSHDRDFLDQTITTLLSFEGNGKIGVNVGGYSDYLETKKTIPKDEIKQKKYITKSTKEVTKSIPKKLSYNEQIDKKELPTKINLIENEIKTLEKKLEDPYLYAQDPDLFSKIIRELENKKLILNTYEDRLLSILIREEELEKE